ncbi:MAG: hypothetical protein H7068_13270 [Pedobacter sp.]|nr:hypothetical protein [Chitinophagaceae bacterium]
MNLPLIIIVAIIALALLIFLIMRNQKDEKKFESDTKNDYDKLRSENGDIDTDHLTNEVH